MQATSSVSTPYDWPGQSTSLFAEAQNRWRVFLHLELQGPYSDQLLHPGLLELIPPKMKKGFRNITHHYYFARTTNIYPMCYSCFAASSCATAVGLWCRFCCLSTGVIRNQCLKYIGHFCRFPDITPTKKIFFLLFVFVFKEDAICEIKMATSTRINISKLLNVPNEQTKKRTQVKAGPWAMIERSRASTFLIEGTYWNCWSFSGGPWDNATKLINDELTSSKI